MFAIPPVFAAFGLEEDDLLSACLLHDVCEDCGVRPEELPVDEETQEYIQPLLEKARDAYPQYSNALFLIRYHMNSVLEALRNHMRSCL